MLDDLIMAMMLFGEPDVKKFGAICAICQLLYLVFYLVFVIDWRVVVRWLK